MVVRRAARESGAAVRAGSAGRAAGRTLLDAGCGTGGLLARLLRHAAGCGDQWRIGLDADRFACERARAKSGRPVCAGSVNALPFADGAFGAIVSADVLCHDGVDEQAALAQFHRVLCDRGILILNLPAYDWLMSAPRQGGRQCQALYQAAGRAAARRRRVPAVCSRAIGTRSCSR